MRKSLLGPYLGRIEISDPVKCKSGNEIQKMAMKQRSKTENANFVQSVVPDRQLIR